jgi:cytochrome c biogenesis protein CcmG, thiol:disulfide interchange protein DsbE
MGARQRLGRAASRARQLPARRRWAVLGGLTAAVALLATGGALWLGGPAPPDVHLADRTDRPAVPISLPELGRSGRTLSLADFRGKPLVVNFWASWCYPCQSEMPVLEEVSRAEHGAVQFLGVDADDTRRSATAFLAKEGVTYPSLFMPDPVAKIVKAYGLNDIPITVFISAAGTMRGSYAGRLDQSTLQAALRVAFGHAR